MKNLIWLALIVTLLPNCSSVPRTKWTDKTRRICIMPDGISAGDYVRIEQALTESGKWVVVDRNKSFEAVVREQNMIHINEPDRFMDKEKFAQMRKLYSCGGAVVAYTQCSSKQTFLFKNYYKHCHQFASIVDTNTATVVAAVEGDSDGSSNEGEIANDWHETMDKLDSEYPKVFQAIKDEQPLLDYKAESAEEAQRAKESLARKPAQSKE